jgi:hypothetical protein
LIASVDIFQLSPGFRTAVFNVHSVLMGVTLVVVFGALVQKITDAQRGRGVGEIMPALMRITLISLFLTNIYKLRERAKRDDYRREEKGRRDRRSSPGEDELRRQGSHRGN